MKDVSVAVHGLVDDKFEIVIRHEGRLSAFNVGDILSLLKVKEQALKVVGNNSPTTIEGLREALIEDGCSYLRNAVDDLVVH